MSKALMMCAFLAIAAPAWADKVTLIVHSDLMGATVFASDGRIMGYTPAVLTYEVGKDFYKHGRCVNSELIRVRWASGAEATTAVALCGRSGKQQHTTFMRPNVEGREVDAMYALEMQKLYMARDDQRRAAYAAFLARQKPIQVPVYQVPTRQSVSCVSEIQGNIVYTRCP